VKLFAKCRVENLSNMTCNGNTDKTSCPLHWRSQKFWLLRGDKWKILLRYF